MAYTSPLRDDLEDDTAASAFRLISSASLMISSTRRSCAARARMKQKHARRNPTPATVRTMIAIVSSNAAGFDDRFFLFADGGAAGVGRGVGAGAGSQRRTVKSTLTSTSARPPFGQ